jgi:hypothetical protein
MWGLLGIFGWISLAQASECLTSAQLEALSGKWSCKAITRLSAPTQDLPRNCHTQGIGIHPESGTLYLSCMDRGNSDRGRFLGFSTPWSSSSQVLELASEKGLKHPSAIQVGSDVIPTAMARSSDNGPSLIRFYRVGSDGALSRVGSELQHSSHLGALAYFTFRGETHLMGCGWDCRNLVAWKTSGSIDGWSKVWEGKTRSITNENIAAYNSIYLTRTCERDEPVLLATAGDKLDGWKIEGLGTPGMKWKRLFRKKADEIRSGAHSLFHEGMTLRFTGGRLSVLAAPDDLNDCGDGIRCATLYECALPNPGS